MTELPIFTEKRIEGVVEIITYSNSDNGYTVAKVTDNTTLEKLTVVGTLPGIQIGETITINGIWTTHSQYGKQFEVSTFSLHPPTTVKAIERYLASGLIKGVGPATANKIVAHFGARALNVLDEQPELLVEVPSIGRKKAQTILSSWQEQKQIKDIMLFLQEYGVGISMSLKIYKQYGDQAIQLMRKNPYQLVHDIYGVGFITADRIALEMGVGREDNARIQAGIIYTLETMSKEGHCYAIKDNLGEKSAELLQVPKENIARVIDELISRKSLLTLEDAIYLPYYLQAEIAVSQKLLALLNTQQENFAIFKSMDWERASNWLDEVSSVKLTSQQKTAVQMVIENKVCILTGGPGTGKSTIAGNIIQLVTSFGLSVLVAAPTGRAAKRLSDTTGLDGMTIHRLLEYSPPGDAFKRNRKNPLKTDLIIIDETSMTDILLMNHLLDAVAEGTHVLFIGDQDQLPSVGPGNVLKDMIQSEIIPVMRLTNIFRQSENSFIIENAHRINQGEMPVFSKQSSDFYLFSMQDANKVEDWIVDIVSNRLEKKFGILHKDIQVLSPIYRGPAGVNALNIRLQQALNPKLRDKVEYQLGDHLFREGDRVMQVRNNYDKSVFNGDIASIKSINLKDKSLVITFDDRNIDYEFSQLDEIQHSFAISIHKSQGAEFPVVVLPMLTSHYIMLQRNLLYTAISRAKNLVVIVGSKRAISMAINNNRTATRNTRLAELLSQRFEDN